MKWKPGTALSSLRNTPGSSSNHNSNNNAATETTTTSLEHNDKPQDQEEEEEEKSGPKLFSGARWTIGTHNKGKEEEQDQNDQKKNDTTHNESTSSPQQQEEEQQQQKQEKEEETKSVLSKDQPYRNEETSNNNKNSATTTTTTTQKVQQWLSSFYRSDPRCQLNLFYESTTTSASSSSSLREKEDDNEKNENDEKDNDESIQDKETQSSRQLLRKHIRPRPFLQQHRGRYHQKQQQQSHSIQQEQQQEQQQQDSTSNNNNNKEENSLLDTAIFTIWRPTSKDAIRHMISKQGVGKGLEIKGKSAQIGCQSGYVPFLQISQNSHKTQIRSLPRDGRTQLYFTTNQQRQQVMEIIKPYQDELKYGAQGLKQTFVLSTSSTRTRTTQQIQSVAKSIRQTGQDWKEKGSTVLSNLRDSVVIHPHSQQQQQQQQSQVVGGKEQDEQDDKDPMEEEENTNLEQQQECLPSSSSDMPSSSSLSSSSSKNQKGFRASIRRRPFHKAQESQQEQQQQQQQQEPQSKHVSDNNSSTQPQPQPSRPVLLSKMKQSVGSMAHSVQQQASSRGAAIQSRLSERAQAFQKLVFGDMADYSVTLIDTYVGVNEDDDDSKNSSMDNNDTTTTTATTTTTTSDDSNNNSNNNRIPRFGLELSDRLLWKALVEPADITRPIGSIWETGRPSQPAFQDMNWAAIYNTRKNQTTKTKTTKNNKNIQSRFLKRYRHHRQQQEEQEQHMEQQQPRVVLVQMNYENPIDPRGLIMAYEENGRIVPVVSDFDCFTMGTRGFTYETPLPTTQIQLLEWCLDNIQQILELQSSSSSSLLSSNDNKNEKNDDENENNNNNDTRTTTTTVNWTTRWLDILKQHAAKGFHPEIPQFGFGDGTSYDIVSNAVHSLKQTGAVRHGAESFNYYFPQDLDDQFLIVSQTCCSSSSCSSSPTTMSTLTRNHQNVIINPKVPWKYVNRIELQEFLSQRIQEGYTFPLNPKWILCDDPNWKSLYDQLLSSPRRDVQNSLHIWYPPMIRQRIQTIHEQYPQGFVYEKKKKQQHKKKKIIILPNQQQEEDDEDDDEDEEEEMDGTAAMDLATLELEQFLVLRRAKMKMICIATFNRQLQELRIKQQQEQQEQQEEEEQQTNVTTTTSL